LEGCGGKEAGTRRGAKKKNQTNESFGRRGESVRLKYSGRTRRGSTMWETKSRRGTQRGRSDSTLRVLVTRTYNAIPWGKIRQEQETMKKSGNSCKKKGAAPLNRPCRKGRVKGKGN